MKSIACIAMAALLSCAGPRPQAVVYVDTDAPVPQMFDRLSLDVLDANFSPVCESCGRDLTLDASTAWPVSFGVAPPDDGSARYLRARLFSSARESVTSDPSATRIERIVQLDFHGAPSRQAVVLAFDCTGIAGDTAARTECVDDTHRAAGIAMAPRYVPGPSRVGTAHADLTAPCAGAPRGDSGTHDADVCVRGGLFWLGDERLVGWGVVTDATPEHAVGVRSYYLDRYEWTVGRYRAAVANGFSFREVPLPPQNPGPFFDGRPGPDCVYTDAPSPTDPLQNDRPLTCVSIELADALCHFAGGALPTEAQWEWAAGSREREWFYPWGDDDPPCGAVVDFTGAFRGMGDPPPSCDPMGGARIVGEPVGSHPYDQTSDGVFDMSGNVSEWVIDPFETYDGGCWDPHRNARVDPRCAPQSGDRVLGDTIRGGSFRGTSTLGFHATNRQSVAPQDVGHTLGFRCARTS